MKQNRLFFLTTVIALSTFGTAMYSSCKKDACNGVSCQNGSGCSNGSCICPVGYSGVFCELSDIVYVNDTYTPITITMNSSQQTIPVSGSVTYTGTSGSAAVVTAYTSATTSSGTQVGALITWPSFTDYFPTGGNLTTEPLDVSATYFFLKMVNNDASQSVVSILVNYGLASQTTDNVIVPNNGNTYGIGYYLAFSNTEVYAVSSVSGNYWTSFPYIPNTLNVSATVTIL